MTLKVLGAVRNIGTVFYSAIVLHEAFTSTELGAYIVTLAGFVLYTYLRATEVQPVSVKSNYRLDMAASELTVQREVDDQESQKLLYSDSEEVGRNKPPINLQCTEPYAGEKDKGVFAFLDSVLTKVSL